MINGGAEEQTMFNPPHSTAEFGRLALDSIWVLEEGSRRLDPPDSQADMPWR